METGVIIHEPVLTKTSAEEAPAGVLLDHSSMDVNKANLSTVLDDEITSHDFRNNTVPGEAGAVVNGSGNKETEESEREKEEAMKTVSVVEDSKIVKETEKDEQSFTFVHEPESFHKSTDDSEKILSDVTSEKVKEDQITQTPEEVSVEKPVKEEEEDSRTVEISVDGTEAEHNKIVSVEETAPEESTTTNGESLHDVEATKRVVEAEEKDETETIKTVIEDPGIVSSEETTVHESETSKEIAEPVETIKHSEDAEHVSREVTVDREKEEDITPKQEEVQESLKVMETPTIQNNESKASKDTEEQEHVLVRDIPQDETLATVDTSTVQESPILKTLETKVDETDAEPSLDLKEVKETEETETVKTVVSSDEVQENITEEVDQSSKDTEEDEHVLGRNMPQGEIFVTEAETLENKEVTEPIMDLKEGKEQEETEKFEEIPSDLALKVDKEEVKDDKINADQVDGAQTMEAQRGLETEEIDGNRTDETEESPVEKLVSHPVVESVKQTEKPSLEPPSEVSEKTSKAVEERIEEKAVEEEVTPHQEGQEESSYGLDTTEEKASVPKSSELGETVVLEERSVIDLTPLQQDSCLQNEQEKESKLEKEQKEKHEPANEEVANEQQSLLEEKSDEVIQVSSASAPEGETIVEDIKPNEEEQEPEKIQSSLLETVETADTEPVKFKEDDTKESSNSTREEIQMKSMDNENVQIDETDEVKEEKDSRTDDTSVNETEVEQNATVSAEEISKNSENIVNETAPEDGHQGKNAEPVEAIKNSDDDVEKVSHEVTGDGEKEELKTRKTEEVPESPTVIETPTIQEENIESEVSKDTKEQENVLVRDMPQIETIVTEDEAVSTSAQEAEIFQTLETTANETDAGQETKEDKEPSLDLKQDQETEETETVKTVISSDEVRLSDQVDVEAEESVEVKSKETVQDESSEKKHENLLDEASGESEKCQDNEPEAVPVANTESQDTFEEIPSDPVLNVDKEEVKDEEKKVDKVDGTQTMEEQRGLDVNDDETDETPVENLVAAEGESTQSQSLVDIESVEKVQKPSLEFPSELSEKTKEETVSAQESRELGDLSQPNEEEKETKLQEEQTEKHEPTSEEVSYHQQSPVEEKSDEVIQVSSSASPSEGREDKTVVEDKTLDEEEPVAEKIQKSLETVETVEAHSSLPSPSEEKEHESVSEKIEEGKLEEEHKSEDDATKSHERQEEFSKTEETNVVEEEQTRDIGSSLSEKCSLDQPQAEEQVTDDKLDGNIDSPTSLMISEKSDNENLSAEAKKEDDETTVRDIPQAETIVSEAEPAVQEAVILKTLETTVKETEAVHSPIGGEEESQVTKEDTKPILDVKEDKEKEETETVKSVVLSDEVNSSDVQGEVGEHAEHCSSEIKDESQGREESAEVKPKEIIQEDKGENLLDVQFGESAEKMEKPSLESPSEISEETSKTVDEKIEEKPEEEVTSHQEGQEEEKETKLEKEQIEKHGSTTEEDANAQQTAVAEKSDEVTTQVSSALASEERESETVVEAEKIEDKKENEEEQVAEKIQRSFETVETDEPHSSFPSPPEEHETVAEDEKIEEEQVKETEPLGDMSEKSLEVSETKDLSIPLEASGSDEAESSELVAESEEQKHKQVKEILEGERKEVDETKAETIPQETRSDVAIEKEETKTKEPEDEHVESSEKNDDETLIAETKKEDEDGSGTKQEEEFENLEAPKLEESKEDKSQEISETIEAVEATDDHTLVTEASDAHQTPSFVSELEDKIPQQIEEIHEEEETTESHKVVEATSEQNLSDETSQAHQTPEHIEEIHEEETKAHKLQEEENLSTETVSREAPVSMLASVEDGQVTVQEGNSACDTKEERHVAEETEEGVQEEQTRDVHVEKEDVSSTEKGETKTKEPEDEHVDSSVETLIAETKKEDEDLTLGLAGSGTSKIAEDVCTKQEAEFENLEAPKPEESKEDKSQEVSETTEAIEATDDHTPSDSYKTPSFISELEDQIPKQIEEIHEETEEADKVEAPSDQNLPDETSQAHQTPKQIEEIHEEETKAHRLQEEENLSTESVPREAPASILAFGEDGQVAVKESNSAGETQDEEKHVSAETKETSTLQNDVAKEEQSPPKNDNPDDTAVEAEHEDENSSTLPVVEILKGLQATLDTERATNESASTDGNMIKEPAEQAQKTSDAEVEVEAETLEKNLVSDISQPETKEKQDEKVLEESSVSEIIEPNRFQQDDSGETEKDQEENGLAKKSLQVEELKLQEGYNEEGSVQDGTSREFEVNVGETREIADRSVTEVVPGEKLLVPSSALPTKESEHVISAEKNEESETQKDVNASIAEEINLQEEHPQDFETSKKEQKAETHETVKDEDQTVGIKEEKKNEEVQDEKLEGLSVTNDDKETFRSEVKKDDEDASKLKAGHDFASPEGEKEEASHSVLGNVEEINEVATSEKEITEPRSEAEKESNEEHVDKPLTKDEQLQIPSTEITKASELIQSPKQVEEEDKNEKTVDALITSENVQVQDQSKDFEQEKKSNDLTYVQEDNATNDSVVAQKEETGLIKEKREVDCVETELEDAIKHVVSTEEKNDESEKIDQEESKKTDIKEEIKEEDQKETTTQETQDCLNSIKNIDNATERTESETREIENLSSVRNTQDKSKQEDEVPKLETLKIAEELQQKNGEAENSKESEPTVNEPARKSLSDLIPKAKGTNKTEDAATKPHIQEEAKTEEEDEDGDEHKDDKTSPDSIVMVEAKDTVNITKTQHKKSQGILSQVKHSISKVKKVLTGKTSHTSKPSSPE